MKNKESKEVWKKIPGYGGRYEVSNLGRVRSIHKSTGRVFILSQSTDKKGYCFVCLRSDGASKRYRVHRLVATAFIPNHENKPQVNHKDGDKSNNRADNLEWATQSENIRHAIHVLHLYSITHRVLTEDQVRMIRSSDKSTHQLARELGVGRTTVKNVRHRTSYKEVV